MLGLEEITKKWNVGLFFPKSRLGPMFQIFLLSVLPFWVALALYRTSPYYQDFLRPEVQTVLLWLVALYTVGIFFTYFATTAGQTFRSKGYVVSIAVWHFSKEVWRYLKLFPTKPTSRTPRLNKEEKIALLFTLVKLFFLPIMLNFLFANVDALRLNLQFIGAADLLSVNGFNTILFPLLLSLLLLIDTAYFTAGYTVAAKSLGNKVRSVEPTVFGWVVALVCYPPFNDILGGYVHWYANDYVQTGSSVVTTVLRILFLVLMAVYVSASVALGFKASNLTNRGIVARGPYAIVRHPAYVSKVVAWWITILPVFSPAAVVSMCVWSGIYYCRAITEERHLIRDPDYQAYCRKVRYRFIPGVY